MVIYVNIIGEKSSCIWVTRFRFDDWVLIKGLHLFDILLFRPFVCIANSLNDYNNGMKGFSEIETEASTLPYK